MDIKAFPRYYQDSTTQLQVKLISAKMQSCVRAYKAGSWFDYMTALEPVKEHTIEYLEKHMHPSSEAIYLEKLTEVLDYYDRVRKQLAEKLATKEATN